MRRLKILCALITAIWIGPFVGAQVLKGKAAFGGWREDKPGVRQRGQRPQIEMFLLWIEKGSARFVTLASRRPNGCRCAKCRPEASATNRLNLLQS